MVKTLKNIEKLIEDMVAGDCGGNPENIQSGTNSGQIVGSGISSRKKDEIEKEQKKEE